MADWKTYVDQVQKEFGEVNNAFAVLTFTDRFEVITAAELLKAASESGGNTLDADGNEAELLLDIRVFDETQEIRMYRDYIGYDFFDIVSLRDDEMLTPKDGEKQYDSFDDYQYLDIDMKRTVPGSGVIKATGGGTYRFPFEASPECRVRIRNYICYDENGQAEIAAWRLAGFAEEKEM